MNVSAPDRSLGTITNFTAGTVENPRTPLQENQEFGRDLNRRQPGFEPSCWEVKRVVLFEILAQVRFSAHDVSLCICNGNTLEELARVCLLLCDNCHMHDMGEIIHISKHRLHSFRTTHRLFHKIVLMIMETLFLNRLIVPQLYWWKFAYLWLPRWRISHMLFPFVNIKGLGYIFVTLLHIISKSSFISKETKLNFFIKKKKRLWEKVQLSFIPHFHQL